MVDALMELSLRDMQVLELKQGEYVTSSALLRLGMCLCSECGHIMSVDNEECRRCRAPKFIVKSKIHPLKPKAAK